MPGRDTGEEYVEFNDVEWVEITGQPTGGLERWQPVVGPETIDLLEKLTIPPQEKRRLQEEALGILARCVPPNAPDQQLTGLVIGYVQSGKTMSFTAVTALAKDNRFPLIVVIAGTSIPLLEQSTSRLRKDFRIAERPDRQWQHFESRNIKANDIARYRRQIASTLDEWRNTSIPVERKRTVLFTVMKHHGHLEILRSILQGVDMHQVPTLIIDDEADQASLNAQVKRGDQSTTYQRILALRDCLPHHTFLQYTATPQAPLLINLIDALSPRFANVITPGQDYVGARTFFLENTRLTTSIPEDEIPTKDQDLLGPPPSLMRAMQVFLLGVAGGLHTHGGNVDNRSMLVHPSHKTVGHQEFERWIASIRTRWQEVLSLADDDPDRVELVDEFREAFDDLRGTVSDIPDFSILLSELPSAIRKTNIKEVNARQGTTPRVDWKADYSHILVGGQAMDRGFTVEGLTVTYMPRGTGTGNVDTILQRARFFGYKGSYLGYCRIYLENRVLDAYTNSVRHEEDIRRQLADWSREGRTLSEWKRAFFLDQRLRPTRSSVLDLDYIRGGFADAWFSHRAPHDSLDAIRENREMITKFLSEISFDDYRFHPKSTPEQVHRRAFPVALRKVYEELLVPYRVTRLEESQPYTGLRLQVASFLESNPDAASAVFVMSSGKERVRSVGDGDLIPNLFQGRNPEKGKGEMTYPGDSEIREQEHLTVQIHYLKIKRESETIESVPVLAVWVPRQMRESWLVQNQGGNA